LIIPDSSSPRHLVTLVLTLCCRSPAIWPWRASSSNAAIPCISPADALETGSNTYVVSAPVLLWAGGSHHAKPRRCGHSADRVLRSTGNLVYCGHVGVFGLTTRLHHTLRNKLAECACPASPFGETLPDSLRNGARWVWPRLVAHIEYREFNGRFRHPVLKAVVDTDERTQCARHCLL
jgi:hypothetical protein